jgi:hypothetical protein
MLDPRRAALIALLVLGPGSAAPGPPPEPPQDQDAPAAPAAPGRHLDSYAEGSADEVFALELEAPKKGLGPVTLPTFAPLEQDYLWPTTFLEAVGPSTFDSARSTKLSPFGRPLYLSRDGARFFIDTRDDEAPDVEFTPNPTPQRIELPAPEGKSAYPLMVSIPGDKESMFSMELNYSPQESGARVRFNIASCRAGKVLGENWRIYDSNISGTYGDPQPWWDDIITRYDATDPMAFTETDAVQIGKSKVALPWSSVLPVGEDFYRATLAPDGSSVTLRKLNLETGFVKLDIATAVAPTHLVIRETSGALDGAFLNVVPAKKGGSVKVPVGSWQIAAGRIEKGAKNSMQQVRIYQGKSEEFEVKAGETATLALGAPYRIHPLAETKDKQLVVDGRSLRVYGRGGEEYAMFFDDPLQPDIEVRTAEGKKVGKPDRMKRTTISEWEANRGDDNLQWFPLDYAIDNPKGENLQVHLTQKTHSLLGGPFDSDWTP